MSDPNDLQAFLAKAWQHLTRGAADAKHPARYPTFATVTPDSKPEARTVALRRADREAGIIEVHTDIATPKTAQLKQNPHAALHVWIPRADLQLRLSVTVQILTGPETEADWAKIPEASRVSYGTMPLPGTPIAQVYDYEKPSTRDRFAVLRGTLTTIDLVELGPRHRRAAYDLGSNWRGTWLAP